VGRRSPLDVLGLISTTAHHQRIIGKRIHRNRFPRSRNPTAESADLPRLRATRYADRRTQDPCEIRFAAFGSTPERRSASSRSSPPSDPPKWTSPRPWDRRSHRLLVGNGLVRARRSADHLGFGQASRRAGSPRAPLRPWPRPHRSTRLVRSRHRRAQVVILVSRMAPCEGAVPEMSVLGTGARTPADPRKWTGPQAGGHHGRERSSRANPAKMVAKTDPPAGASLAAGRIGSRRPDPTTLRPAPGPCGHSRAIRPCRRSSQPAL
jgi:hypothetical protein